MSRTLERVIWVLFAAVMYLILAASLRHWVELPTLGNIGLTLVFVLFSTVHCGAYAGWKKTGLFFATAAVISYLLEEIGVRTGLVYGHYHYSDMLGPKLGHVPFLIPLAWFMMIYPSWMVAQALLRVVEMDSVIGLTAHALIAALVMTAWDTVMDPGMSAAGNWTWEQGGPYFGVPFHNYFGWLLTTFLVYLGAGLLWRRIPRMTNRFFVAMPIIMYGGYGLSYTTPRPQQELQLVALFTMVFPTLVALLQTLYVKELPAK